MSITIGEVGEFGLIARLVADLPRTSDLVLGPGDDAAVLRAPDARVVATTDLLVDGRHFRRDWSPARDVGHKAAAQNLADVAAMGARPTGLLLGLAAPPDLPLAWAEEMMAGLAAEAAAAGAVVAGGDVVASPTLTLAVTALGDLGGRPALTRSGARPGDLVAVAGLLGHSAAGLALLQADPPGGFQAGPPGGFEALVAAHRRPRPPYAEGPRAAELGATALIDVSDGLLADLGHIATASGVGIDLLPEVTEAPPELVAAAEALRARHRTAPHESAPHESDRAGGRARHEGREGHESDRGADQPPDPSDRGADQPPDPRDWVLRGGEDHALAGTFPAAPPGPWRVIGRVREGTGITVPGGVPGAGEGDTPSGWDHFRD